jgi:tight adherence protein B
MTTAWWVLASGLLVAAGVTAAWPMNTARRRLRGPRQAPATIDRAALNARLEDFGRRHPRRLVAGAAGATASVALLAGGPVAAAVGGVYAALAVRAGLRRTARRRDATARAGSLDHLCALAADLRAGLPPAAVSVAPPLPAASAGGVNSAGRRLADLTDAVWRLAEHTGAPAADLVERIEADARATDRAMASAAAQSAGAQATAVLLATLPLGGIALGYGIGVDPLAVLLHTALGAACAIGAVLLQCAGLLWADRLVTGPAR